MSTTWRANLSKTVPSFVLRKLSSVHLHALLYISISSINTRQIRKQGKSLDKTAIIKYVIKILDLTFAQAKRIGFTCYKYQTVVYGKLPVSSNIKYISHQIHTTYYVHSS